MTFAKEIGLDEEKARAIADDETAYLEDVQQDIQHASKIGVRGVPYYVFNDQYAMSGAQTEETFVELLEKLKKELDLKTPLQVVGDTDGTCGTNDCLL